MIVFLVIVGLVSVLAAAVASVAGFGIGSLARRNRMDTLDRTD